MTHNFHKGKPTAAGEVLCKQTQTEADSDVLFSSAASGDGLLEHTKRQNKAVKIYCIFFPGSALQLTWVSLTIGPSLIPSYKMQLQS